MNLISKGILIVLICLTCQFNLIAGVVSIGNFDKSKSDTPKKEIHIKQIVVRNNQFINRNVYLANISNDYNPDLIIMPLVKYEVTQDSFLNKFNLTKESKTVEFKVTSGAYIKVNKLGNMIFSNGTKLHLATNATLEISDSAILSISNKSILQLDSGAILIIRGTGVLNCKDSSKIIIHPFSNIILQHQKSSIQINSGSEINTKENYLVSYEGEGKIFINKMDYYKIYKN